MNDSSVSKKCKFKIICRLPCLLYQLYVLLDGNNQVQIINLLQRGPIWWQQYPAKINITEGCFTPFHPGIIYIARSDGFVDIWDLTKQIHKPVTKVLVSGFSISGDFYTVTTLNSTTPR